MNKTKKVNALLIALIYAIIFAVLNVLIFVIFKPGKIDDEVAKTNFWVTYAFVVIFFACQVGSIFLFDKKSGLTAVFMGLPVFMISAIALGIELVIALIFFTLSAFECAIPSAVVVVVQILVLAVYLIIAILAILAKNHISGLDEKIKKNVTTIRNLEADVRIAMEACSNPEVKEVLRKFADDIRFSDPMTTPEVEVLDVQIQTTIMDIKQAAYDGKEELVVALVRRGTLQLKERNMKVINSK